jgi:mutator family transposase
VQRCRNHKMRNGIDELPKEQQSQALNLMRAAWRVSDAVEGIKRLEQSARFLEQQHESAAKSLREGMADMFTLQRLQLPPSLYKCLEASGLSPSSSVENATSTPPPRKWRNMKLSRPQPLTKSGTSSKELLCPVLPYYVRFPVPLCRDVPAGRIALTPSLSLHLDVSFWT